MNNLKLKMLIFILIFYVFGSAQDHYSVHQIELENHKNDKTHPSLTSDKSQQIIPLQTTPSKLTAAVFGYLPYWASSNYLDYSLLSHIAAFSVEINSNGTLGDDHGWPWTNLINTAHSNGVKVILTATLFNGNDISTLINTSSYRNAFFVNIKNKMLEGSTDGINIDFESLLDSDKGANIINFMSDLTIYLHSEVPGSEVSFAGPAVNWGGHWDLMGLANACDYIFIMGYAFAGAWNTQTGANSPLIGGSYNITNTVNNQYGLVTQTSPEKLILGIPYYGHHWLTVDNQPRSTVTNFEGSITFSSAQPGAISYGRIWDTVSETPWYRYNDGNDWHQVWFDDDSSLGLKYDLAQSKNLQGVGMWALGYDGNRPELWNELYEHFGSGTVPPPGTPEAFRVLIEDSSGLRIQFRESSNATGYFIYLSGDGINFTDSVFAASNNFVLTNLEEDSLYYIRVKSVNSTGLSSATEVLAGIPSSNLRDVLVVNGFDRTSGTVNTLDFIRQHGHAIKSAGYSFSSASNEAIYLNYLSLKEFRIVDWILGEEGTSTDCFNSIEQDSVELYLKAGGKLLISGSEIGYDLSSQGSTADQNFYNNYLKAQYISDAPNSNQSTYYTVENITGAIFDGMAQFNFDDGSHGTYNVDWPDAIKGFNGGVNCLKYVNVSQNDGVSAISFDGLFPNGQIPGKLVYMAVPFETIYPATARDTVMFRIFDFFESPPSGIVNNEILPKEISLAQNHPNPFNPVTTINFSIAQPANTSLVVYNMLGQRIAELKNEFLAAGDYSVKFNGTNLSSGTYVYILKSGIQQQHKKMLLIK